MKFLIRLLLLVVILYALSPFWRGPASQYIDVSWLDPIDAQMAEWWDDLKANPYVKEIANDLRNETTEIKEKIPAPTLEKPDTELFAVNNIQLGDSEDDVISLYGKPDRISMNEYKQSWYTYHQDYQHFFMLTYDAEKKVNGFYTNQDLLSSKDGIKWKSSKESIRTLYGEPLKSIRKGLVSYIISNEDIDTYLLDGQYVTFFYDKHANNELTAIQVLSESMEMKKEENYAAPNPTLEEAFAVQLFDLTNAERVSHGLSVLEWSTTAAKSAVLHSSDMAKNNYFAHENLSGQSPFDRMEAQGLRFRLAGENLAYGQNSSIFAHEGLMNSLGHRENILLADYTNLGVGVDINDKKQPYYTENFFGK
ncbi:CAP domain-containing protein [Paenisporosarcina cavernae]|uniref:Serine protease n=1 Tax=Paenisporosarcina cavernae TaxID=2320858 RepID=A0A385YX59_9BACL|nr:CAP domain-containing protein [Paenisporosarcina cavernae]AYC30268.1 serine protease [Paenisporosarcina cavernae]